MSPAAAVDPTIRDYARRLGLLVSTSSDDDGDGDGGDSFLRLAAENMRRVASARVVATLRVPSGCQAVMALHLAAEARSRRVDLAEAEKLAGTRKNKYLNLLENVRNDLGLVKTLTVEEAASKLGCQGVRVAALGALDRYRRKKAAPNLDRPVYPCAAVAAACAASKPRVRLDGELLLELSGASKRDLDAIVKAMLEQQKEDGGKEEKEKNGKRRTSRAKEDDVTEKKALEGMENGGHHSRGKKSLKLSEEEEEGTASAFDMSDYEEWKDRMLAEAGIKES